MRPHDGGVDRDVSVDLPGRVGLGLDLLDQAFPGSVGRPQAVAFIDGLPRAEPFGQVTSLNAGPHPVQNPVDHLSVIPPPTATPVADRQERPQPFPLDIRCSAPHAEHTFRIVRTGRPPTPCPAPGGRPGSLVRLWLGSPASPCPGPGGRTSLLYHLRHRSVSPCQSRFRPPVRSRTKGWVTEESAPPADGERRRGARTRYVRRAGRTAPPAGGARTVRTTGGLGARTTRLWCVPQVHRPVWGAQRGPGRSRRLPAGAGLRRRSPRSPPR